MTKTNRLYAIFGAGRVGTNIAGYLEDIGHKATLITRAQSLSARDHYREIVKTADVVAAAIPDDALANWFREWRGACAGAHIIHFSGGVSVEGMDAYHPLYSFPPTRLDQSAMQTIAFACPENGPAFSDVFPGAENPHFKIAESDRARYHALAVLSGNMASFIWNETAKEFAGIAREDAHLMMQRYLMSIVERFSESPYDSMTGPVARKDRATVAKNLDAIADRAVLKTLYQAFLDAAWPDYERGNT